MDTIRRGACCNGANRVTDIMRRRVESTWAGAKIFVGALIIQTGSGNTILAAEVPEEWPCEQAYVSEVAAAVVWDGPSVNDLQHDWRRQPATARLVKQLSNRRIEKQQAEALIEDFAITQAPEEKDRMLTLVFAGVLETLNLDRKTLLSGILRYSRDQQRRAEILDRKLSEMVTLEQDGTESAKRQLVQLSRTMELEQRSFDDRERTIPHLCTRPTVIETRLGEIARTISDYLD